MITATATDIQNNFGRYLQIVQNGEEVVILKNGRETARLISYGSSISFLTDSLIGVLQNDYDEQDARRERLAKYESAD
ncbi:MAG: type II toxin-antitoxin system prevent-host-death family antitoxin [Oscillospiraceae bacterium]|nr:type II toxin-antitoxin system prevent-host-death family antitoxin [Oscillospiraceae bacterium]MCD8255534.1 type II toxin-antitoxin system prevent-host-death family antitoxin [Oscillospiraceae bacterium]